jgi:penicillin-binding protein 2
MRTKIVIGVIFLFYSLLIGRLFQLMVIEGGKYQTLSYRNFLREVEIPPVRGIIYDRLGTPVAYNQVRFNIGIKPHLRERELNLTLLQLKELLPEVNLSKLRAEYKKWNSPYYHRPIVVLKYLTQEQIYRIEPYLKLNPFITIETGYLRKYPFGPPLSNVLGYVSEPSKKDLEGNPVIELTHQVGKGGIEKYYDPILQGEPGLKREIVDAKNRVLTILINREPISTNLKLTIDHRLQQFIYRWMEEHQARGGVVVMKTNGEVLALVTYPSYDNNLFVKGLTHKKWQELLRDIYHPLWNRPIMGLYPPGSTVKPFEGLIGLSAGVIKPFEKIFCPYYIEVGNRKFRDWKRGGHGWTDLIKAIEESVDVYFYKLGLELGIDRIGKGLKRMGWGVKTGIDLPGEQRGVVPSKEWKWRKFHRKWLIGDTLNAVIGQGYFLATPIQVARGTALLATGKLPTPYLVQEIGETNVSKGAETPLSRRELQLLKYIRAGMYQVCQGTHGTATYHITTPVELGCKTGTAQVHTIPQEVLKRKREEELNYFHRSHAWLTTYGPWRHPEVVVTILIEHGGHGGSAGGPLASAIYNWLLDHGYLHLKPEDLVGTRPKDLKGLKKE